MLTFDPKNIGPLDGIRLLDLSRLIAGERVEVDSVLAVRMASHEIIGIGHAP